MLTLIDVCASSLRRGRANLLCIVPILTDDPRRESKNQRKCHCSSVLRFPEKIVIYLPSIDHRSPSREKRRTKILPACPFRCPILREMQKSNDRLPKSRFRVLDYVKMNENPCTKPAIDFRRMDFGFCIIALSMRILVENAHFGFRPHLTTIILITTEPEIRLAHFRANIVPGPLGLTGREEC